MDVVGFVGGGFEFGLEAMLVGASLLLEAGFGLGDGLLEGVDFVSELVVAGAGGVESVVFLERVLVLGVAVGDAGLAGY